MKRVVGLDIFRGYAIVLMVIFHLSFDLNNFHIIDINIRGEAFWIYFRFYIVAMFVFSAGVSLKLAHFEKINPQSVKKRVLTLGFAAFLVSVGSYTQFPNTWIYFGVLHFILFASILGLAFLKTPKFTLIVALAIILGHYYKIINVHFLFEFLKAPLHLPYGYTEDLVKIFPWFGVFLLGIVFASFNLHRVVFDNKFFNYPFRINKFFAFLGRHSLVIYLVHQPILFGLLYSYKHFL